MGRRPDRTARRKAERAARQTVRDRERLAKLVVGGSAERPIEVPASSVIAVRARATPCPQCEGTLHIEEEQAPSALVRRVVVRCQRCGVGRDLWFRIAVARPS